MLNRPCCPRCQSVIVVKSGSHHGKQRWLCKRCRYQFTIAASAPGSGAPLKQAAVTLYRHGLSFRSVARLLATSAQSVIRWVTSYIDSCCVKPVPEKAVVVEVDEMWHYLGHKANKLWIWTAFDRDSGRLIDWECGKRDQATFERLLSRLKRWHVRLFCTDDYIVYENRLAVGQHDSGKDRTVAVERMHGRLRHWLARFRRRTCVVSRSKPMIDRSIALFAHLHVNGGVEPSFFHLPLAPATA
jgi:insertion element IS1 protein InsB